MVRATHARDRKSNPRAHIALRINRFPLGGKSKAF
jgi:hypothetical protein